VRFRLLVVGSLLAWPGFGPRSRANDGDPIGRSTFVVKR
jgi:hypothetical protein